MANKTQEPGPHETLVLTLRCRAENLPDQFPTRPLVEKGRRFDLELESRRADGTFISQVQTCEKPLSNNDEGEILLRAAVPVTHSSLFVEGSRVKLRHAQYVIAQCDVLRVESPV